MITKNNCVKHKHNTNTIIVHLSYYSHISVLRYCKNIKARLCSLLHEKTNTLQLIDSGWQQNFIIYR